MMSIMDEASCFYKNGLKFSCQRCSFCCGHSPGYVYLSRADLDRFCQGTGLSIKEFVSKYCRWADYYEGKTVLALLEKRTTTASSGTTAVRFMNTALLNAAPTLSGPGL